MNEQKHTAPPSLDEVYKLAKENNRMLRAMRRDALVGGIFKFLLWVALFVVVPYVLYTVYLEPYLAGIQSAYDDFNRNADTLSGAAKDFEAFKNSIPNFGDAIKRLQGGGE